MPEPFIISPAGFIVEYSYASPANGLGTFGPPAIRQPLPGAALSVRSPGQYAFPYQMSGRQGRIRIVFTTGTAGTARALAFLVDNGDAPTKFLGIGLDTSNRPTVYMHNASGGLVGVFVPSGGAIAADLTLTLDLSWHSSLALSNTRQALLTLDGVDASGSWSTDPSTPWLPFAPAALLVGSVGASSFQSLSAFNGVLKDVQVSATTAVQPIAAPLGFPDTFLVDPDDLATIVDQIDVLLRPKAFLFTSDTADVTDSVVTALS